MLKFWYYSVICNRCSIYKFLGVLRKEYQMGLFNKHKENENKRTLMDLKGTIGAAEASISRIERSISELKSDAEKFEKYSEKASQDGQEADAAAFLEKSRKALSGAEELSASLAAYKEKKAALEESYNKLSGFNDGSGSGADEKSLQRLIDEAEAEAELLKSHEDDINELAKKYM